MACSPASSPAFMSVTPGPVARSPLDRYGRAAAVPALEDGVHVADEEQPRAVARRAGRSTRSPSCGSPVVRRVAHALDRRRRARRSASVDEVGDAVHAVGRVRAAIDVDERLELGQVARQARLDGAPQRGRVGHGDQYTHGHAAATPSTRDAGVELVELRVLDGPNRFFTRPAVKLEFVGEEPGRRPRRRPSAALGRAAPPRRAGPARAAHHDATARSTACAPRSPSRGAGGPSRRPSAAAAARLALGRSTDRRELAGLRATALGPLRAPAEAAHPDRGRDRHEREEHHDAADRPHRLARPACKVGMTNSDGIYVRGELVEAGDWSGFGGAGRVLAEPGLRSGRARDGARRDPAARRSATRPTT